MGEIPSKSGLSNTLPLFSKSPKNPGTTVYLPWGRIYSGRQSSTKSFSKINEGVSVKSYGCVFLQTAIKTAAYKKDMFVVLSNRFGKAFYYS